MWNVIPNVVGDDVEDVDAAIKQAKQSDKPTPAAEIRRRTRSARARQQGGSHDSHGAALSDKGSRGRRAEVVVELPLIPQEVYAAWDAKRAGARNERDKAFAAVPTNTGRKPLNSASGDAKQLPC